jgi:hypothetical protein
VAYTFSSVATNALGTSAGSAASGSINPVSSVKVFETVKVTQKITKTAVSVITAIKVPGAGKITQIATTRVTKKKKAKKAGVSTKAGVSKKKKKKAKTKTRCKATKIVKVAGSFPMTCKMNKKSRKELRKKAMTLTIRTTFTPKVGKPTVKTKIVKLKRKR